MRLLLSLLTGAAATAAALTLATATSAPAAATATVAPAATTYAVDLSHSNILFKVKHLGVAYQWGRFDQFEGMFTLDKDPAKSSVEITVKAESVNSNDEGRDKHLRGADFFNVKEFEDMTFKSTKVEAKDGDVFAITGDLTLRGKTNSITFDVTKVGEGATRMGDRCGFEGAFVIDRMDYGVSYGGNLLGHDVHMHFAIEGIKK